MLTCRASEDATKTAPFGWLVICRFYLLIFNISGFGVVNRVSFLSFDKVNLCCNYLEIFRILRTLAFDCSFFVYLPRGFDGADLAIDFFHERRLLELDGSHDRPTPEDDSDALTLTHFKFYRDHDLFEELLNAELGQSHD